MACKSFLGHVRQKATKKSTLSNAKSGLVQVSAVKEKNGSI